MTGDDIGLHFFTEQTPPTPPAKASAFGPVDQDALIARIDAVEEDDLTSSFFGDSILDVENAATRAFDIGIRMHDPSSPSTHTASGAAVPMTTAGIDASPAPAADPIEEPHIGGVAEGSRTAFILGGPAGLQ